VHDNENYGLTTGQASPTTPEWIKTSSTPSGNPYHPFNPIKLVQAAGAKFTKQVEDKNLQELIASSDIYHQSSVPFNHHIFSLKCIYALLKI